MGEDELLKLQVFYTSSWSVTISTFSRLKKLCILQSLKQPLKKITWKVTAKQDNRYIKM